MAYKRGLFNDWVPKAVGLLGLIVIFIPLITVNGVYTANISDLVGSLGTLSEDITFASYASTVGMLAAFPILIRLKQYMKSRNILLMVLLALVILSLVCANTTAIWILTLGNFLLGGFKMIGMIEVIIPFMFIISPTGDRARFYSVFYPISISLGTASGLLTANMAYTYNWQYVYYFSIPFLLIAIAFVLVIFHRERSMRKVPLYQVDWLSMIVFSTMMLLINYICVYGKVEDWLHSIYIQGATVVLPILVLWFIKRQINRKRPYLDFDVLKYRNVRISLLLMFLMQVLFNTGAIQGAFTTTILKLDVPHNAMLSMWMIPGVLAGAVLCFIWFQNQKSFRGIIMIGFAALVMYHLILFFKFHPGAGMHDLYVPMALKGLSMLVLYVSLGVLIAQKLPMTGFLTSGMFLLMFRSGIGLSVTTAFYANAMYQEQVQNTTELAGKMDVLDPNVAARINAIYGSGIAQGKSVEAAQSLAAQSINGTVQIQSLMVAAKNIYGHVVIAGGAILLFVLVVPLGPPNKRKLAKWRRRWKRENTIPVSV